MLDIHPLLLKRTYLHHRNGRGHSTMLAHEFNRHCTASQTLCKARLHHDRTCVESPETISVPALVVAV